MRKIENLNSVLSCGTFFDFAENINKWYGDSAAFNDGNQTWSYKEVYNMIRKAYSGINTENTIYCIDVKNPVLFFATFMAVTISGNIAWLNSSATDEEFIYISDAEAINLINTESDSQLKNDYITDEVSVVAMSSGTTSVSKGVMLTQKNILSDTVAGMQLYDYHKGAVYYNVLPYKHLFGLVADLLGPLYSGGTICFCADKFNLFRNLCKFKPTHMNLPPAVVYIIERMLVVSLDTGKVTGGKLTKIMCAGASVRKNTCEYLKQKGISVFAAYGLTECSPCVSMNSDLYNKIGSVGVIMPGIDVLIKDAEILVRGDIVMKGYWKDKVATDRVLNDGWLRTGDLGYLDEEGFLFITGRKNNLIVFSDGTKISPESIEKSINIIKGVAESLVSASSIKERIDVCIVLEEDSNCDRVKSLVDALIDERNIKHRINRLYYTKTPLKKNELGKAIRNGL